MSIKSALKALFITEMVPSGLLEKITSVDIDAVELRKSDAYPVLAIVSNEGEYVNNRNHLNIEHVFDGIVHVLGPSIPDSEDTRDKIIFDSSTNPKTGLICFFNKIGNGQVTADGVTYNINYSNIKITTGIDIKGRDTAQALFQIKVWTKLGLDSI
jgi:translation elongation factor EF-4